MKAARNSTQEKPTLSDADLKNTLALELIRAHDLLGLAHYRAANSVNDSPLLTLLAATQDRVRTIARHMGIEDQLGGAEAAEARVTA